MKPSWRHGVAVGILVSFSFAFFQIYYDTERQDSDMPSLISQNATEPEIKPETETKPLELPFGGRELLPKYRFTALYGSPAYKGLGALGEQPLKESIVRAKELATTYQEFSKEKVIPTFEIVATIASAELTENQDYSRETAIEKLKPWIDSAKEQGIYVLLDLQPGRSTFLTQAKLYKELLLEPHVGLALDPEWRLQKPTDRHLRRIGSVTATEVNETSNWLAELVKENNLPQKMFMVHQFKLSMITERETLITNRKELSYILHMDGHGSLEQKTTSYTTIQQNQPTNTYLGWKNFYDEDKPTPTPQQTMQQDPKPWFISYQ